jgi:hypothetical protein
VDTTFAPTTSSDSPLWRRWLFAEILAVIVGAALVISVIAQLTGSSPDVASGDAALSPQQIVTRGEVADRYGSAGSSGLTPQQVVIRSEVADRYNDGATSLSPQQIVTRAEVADRYAK